MLDYRILVDRLKDKGPDHLTLEGGGGRWMISKNNFVQALVGRKKLRAAQMK